MLAKLAVPIERPPVGFITLRGRRVTPGAAQLIDALREAARRPAPVRAPRG